MNITTGFQIQTPNKYQYKNTGITKTSSNYIPKTKENMTENISFKGSFTELFRKILPKKIASPELHTIIEIELQKWEKIGIIDKKLFKEFKGAITRRLLQHAKKDKFIKSFDDFHNTTFYYENGYFNTKHDNPRMPSRWEFIKDWKDLHLKDDLVLHMDPDGGVRKEVGRLTDEIGNSITDMEIVNKLEKGLRDFIQDSKVKKESPNFQISVGGGW